MPRSRDAKGEMDTQDIPQEPRRSLRPVPPAKPAPLSYYVTTEKKSSSTIFGPADVSECTSWARREAVSRSTTLDVRESGTGTVFFRFNKEGNFA